MGALDEAAWTALAAAPVRGSFVLADDGFAALLRSCGGPGRLLELGARSVVRLAPASDAQSGSRLAETLARLERSPSRGLDKNGKDSSQPLRLLVLVSRPLWDLEDQLGQVLAGDYSTTWVVAQVLCSVSKAAHGAVDGRAKAGVDTTALALKLQQLARPNAAEVSVRHVAAGLCPVIDASDVGVFTLAQERLRDLWPVTLSRLGTAPGRDMSTLDGNSDLSGECKADIKMLAHTLLGALRDQLGLEVKRCWAAGFTSRLLGNALVAYAEQARAGGTPAPTLPPTKAKIVLVDRTLDLVSALREADGSQLQRMHNALARPGTHKDELSQCLGPLSLEHAWRHSDLLRQACVGRLHNPAAASELQSDPCYLDNLGKYQIFGAAALAAREESRLQQRCVVERIILNAEDETSALLPLVDLLNRGATPVQEALALAVLAASHVGQRLGGRTVEDDTFELLLQALTTAVVSAGGDEQLGGVLPPEAAAQLERALREIRRGEEAGGRAGRGAFACDAIAAALSGQPSPLVALGQSALEQTAKDFGKQVGSLLGGLGVLGFQKSAAADSAPNQLSLEAGDTLVVFLTGGVTFHEVQELVSLTSDQNIRLLIGGTRLATPEQALRETFRVAGGTAAVTRPAQAAAARAQQQQPQHEIAALF